MTSFLTSQQRRTSLWNDSKTSLHWWCFYEGHTLCFAIWFFNNSYNHSVYSSFSKKPPSACTHLTLLSNQLSMTPDHVYSGMSKMTPSKNARASSEFWNCFPFICLLTEGNKNQSQEAESDECGGWVTSRTSLAAKKSRVTAAVCALALPWWGSRQQTLVPRRRLHHAWETLGKKWLTYQSTVIVFLSSSGLMTTVAWETLGKKWLTYQSTVIVFLSSSGLMTTVAEFCKETRYHLFGSTSSRKTHTADCCFVSR